jgi:hypothetical protein
MSISRENFDKAGLFHAVIMAKIFNGALPGNLNQEFMETPYLAINLISAKNIGFYLSAELLAAADKLYPETITLP